MLATCTLMASPPDQRRGGAPTGEARGGGSVEQARIPTTEHAVAGEVIRVDEAAQSLVVRTAEGGDQILTFTRETVVRGLEDVSRMTDAAAKIGLQGTSAVVRFNAIGLAAAAVSVERVGEQPLRVIRGSIARVDEAGTFVVVRTTDGGEDTISFATHAVLDGPKGARDAAVGAVRSIKPGATVTVHYSDDGGQKLAHLLKHA
jgi:hypothetical protein